MKKITGVFWVICFVVASLGLVGCGGGKQDAAPSAKQDAPPAKQETLGELFTRGKNLPGMSYDFVMTAEGMNMTGTVWLSGKKMKSEMIADNSKMVTLVDGDANVAYTYNPEQGVAFKIPLDNNLKTADTPDHFTKDVDAAKVKVLESTTYDGVKCKVLLTQENDGKSQTKLWVREDYGIPLRVEVIEANGNKNMVMEYKNLKVGAQPATAFQMPEGVEVMDMGEMMKGLPKQ